MHILQVRKAEEAGAIAAIIYGELHLLTTK